MYIILTVDYNEIETMRFIIFLEIKCASFVRRRYTDAIQSLVQHAAGTESTNRRLGDNCMSEN